MKADEWNARLIDFFRPHILSPLTLNLSEFDLEGLEKVNANEAFCVLLSFAEASGVSIHLSDVSKYPHSSCAKKL